MSASWYRCEPGAVVLTLHVQPNARTSGFAGLHGDALRVRVAAPAVDDKANKALLEFLSRELRLPAKAVTLRHGHHGRRKVVVLAAGDGDLPARLDALAAS